MNRDGVFVLRSLDQKHHQESNDRRARVDDELPRIRKMKERSGDGPNNNGPEREQKSVRGAGGSRGLIGKPLEQISPVLSSHRTLSCNPEGQPFGLTDPLIFLRVVSPVCNTGSPWSTSS